MCCREVQLSRLSGKLTSHSNMNMHKCIGGAFQTERGRGVGVLRLCGVCEHESGLGREEAEDSCVVERYSYQVCQES